MNSPSMESKAQNSPTPGYIERCSDNLIIQAIGTKVSFQVREDCCTWSTWFPPLSWCSYFGGYLMLKRPLPKDRDSRWIVLPSPCPVSRPGCTPQVAGWALLTQINQSHKCVPFSLKKSSTMSCWIQKEERGHIHIQVRWRDVLMAKSVLFVKTQCCVFVLFSSKAAKLSLAFHLSQARDHKRPGFFPGAELKLELSSWSPSVSQCECVSLFVLRVCFLSPLFFSLSPTDWLSHLVSTSLSLSLSSVCLSLWQPHKLLLNMHHAQTVLLLLCAGITDSFCTLSGRESSCSNSSHCLPSNSSYSFVCFNCLQLKE